MTLNELASRLRTICDDMDAMLGVNPGASRPKPVLLKGKPLSEMVYAAAKPMRKRGRPKGSKNKPKE